MNPLPLNRRAWLATLPVLGLAACATDPRPAPAVMAAPPAAQPQAAPTEAPLGAAVARVEIRKWQVGFIGQVHWGEGVLIHLGQRLPFRIRGIGAGGVGMARIRATGDVFNMTDVTQFAGVYGQARAGLVAPGAQMRGGLWLQNTSGVRLRLQPNRTGLAAQLGADGILIEMV